MYRVFDITGAFPDISCLTPREVAKFSLSSPCNWALTLLVHQMGHSIPVFYLTCEEHECPKGRTSWNDAQQIVEKAFQDKEKYHLHQATGRNWWQIQAISEIRDSDRLDGLEFLDKDMSVIDPERLPVVIESLRTVIAARQALGQIGSPLAESHEREIDCDCDGGFEKFLSSLLFVFEIARASGRSVVFVQPQP